MQPRGLLTVFLECIYPPASMASTPIRGFKSAVSAPTSPEPSVSSPRHSPILGPVRIGILGGTFDPIHIAHMHAAETALFQANLDRLLFMPAGEPWQKGDRDVTDSRHRATMVRLAIGEVPGFDIDLREVERSGPTYTADTLASFSEDDDLFLLMGADTALGIDTWHEPERVLRRAAILIVPRPGWDAEAAVSGITGSRLLDMAAFDMSSTLIRSMARNGRPFRYLVPGEVYEYIEANNLYTNTESDDMVLGTTTEESSS